MVDHKNTIEQIKALSEDILEYRSVDVKKGYMRMDKRIQKKQTRHIYMHAVSRVAVILLLPLLVSSIVFSYLYMRAHVFASCGVQSRHEYAYSRYGAYSETSARICG